MRRRVRQAHGGGPLARWHDQGPAAIQEALNFFSISIQISSLH
jgi:hypothetical protein